MSTIVVDRDDDMAYLTFSHKTKIQQTVQITPDWFNIDFDLRGNIVGIELIGGDLEKTFTRKHIPIKRG